jgi:UDP-sulfoquinovose synthase
MRVLVLGGDGYLGWPTSMAFAAAGHQVRAVDNYTRRRIAAETNSEALFDNPRLDERAHIFNAASNHSLEVRIGDCADYGFVAATVRDFAPEAIVHYAEQPSAPYSMIDFAAARFTLNNNLNTTFNILWAIREHCPDAHLIKLGTMGEYGTPNIDIEEGWIDIEHNGRKDRFLFPRQAGSLYHTTKVLDTDLIWFYVRTYGLRVTDLMQGPVYGLATAETAIDPRLSPNFHYDDIFGTVLNRFIVQAVAGVPLTVYGKGDQVRGYLNLIDTLQCIELAARNPAARGELRVFNQFTETFSVNQLAARVQHAARGLGLDAEIRSIPNPRKEKEEHYYNPKFTGLKGLGLRPHLLTDDVLCAMIEEVAGHKDRINVDRIFPRVRWN